MKYPDDFLGNVICGDCLEVMPLLPPDSVDVIVTDPPFAFAGGSSNGFASKADAQFYEHWLISIFKEFYRVSKPTGAWFLWGDWRIMTVYDSAVRQASPDYYSARRLTQVLIHDREMIGLGTPFRNQTDYIALIPGTRTVFNIPKTQSNIIRSYWYYGKHEYHPAEKSVKIAKLLIEWITNPGNIILDSFSGSGTIAVASKQLGRQFIAIDRDENYCQIARKRIAESLQQMPLQDSLIQVQSTLEKGAGK